MDLFSKNSKSEREQDRGPNQRPDRRTAGVMAGLALVALFIAAMGPTKWLPHAQAAELWTTQSTSAPVASIDINSLNKAFTTLAEKTSPAVVNIFTKTSLAQHNPSLGRSPWGPGGPGGPGQDFQQFFFGNPFGGRGMPQQPHESQALGSGFVINADGYIVTNAHVVSSDGQRADEIMVKFNGEDNLKGHLAKVVGIDEGTDVALLKLVDKKENLKFIPLGDSDHSKIGEWVVAIGNPYGHSNTLTQGIVSAMGRNLEGARPDFIQTSASINPGNSGGPLINLAGEVIGINTAMDPRAQSIGFAIPINTAKNVITQLMATGKVTRAWLGIGIQDIDDEIAGYMKLKSQDGVLVKAVSPGEPAAKAGMQDYDVITSIDGQAIRNSKDLFRSMDKLTVGSRANFEVLRGQEKKVLKVKVGEQPALNIATNHETHPERNKEGSSDNWFENEP
jgi:serine protease Do